MSDNSSEKIDPNLRKQVLRMIPYGIHVLTATHGGQVAAATIDWVTQASFEPPMVVCCIRRDSQIYGLVRDSGYSALHPLSEGQKPYAMKFFKNREATATHINGQPYKPGPHDVPLLEEAPAYIVLRKVDQLTQSDHAVVLSEVVDIGLRSASAPRPLLLSDTGWNYGG